ncbi:MAG: hypothetical protein ACRCYX_15565 [Dermatophilaceae bacterium]
MNEWANAQRTRRQECKPGTNAPKVAGGRCSVSYLGKLQRVRYEVRDAGNRMSTVESEDASSARALFGLVVPSAAPREPGPAEGPVLDSVDDVYSLFLGIMRCDTNPTVTSCSEFDEQYEGAWTVVFAERRRLGLRPGDAVSGP